MSEVVSAQSKPEVLFGETELPLSVIRIDGGTQPREGLNNAYAAELAEQVRLGAQPPPITVFFDGANYWLADGFHRFKAYEELGSSTALANVQQGTQRDAILFSVGANASHGLRRTNADKRRAIMRLLTDSEWS
ncbi:MAG: ParB/RepB/Spo0J family partition protein, partial [Pseudanabaenales cyanobacterium]|nr:ParB/RepB/Spo0J family partition protein [Pseudanabaenales cyanobacterium]